ncbi:MAG: nitroreductase family protein [Actinomycetota bacterium]
MEFRDVLRRRRMVRRYTGDAVPAGAVDRIVEAGVRGPSAGWSQGISVVSVTDRGTIAAIAHACGEHRYVAAGFDPWLSTAGALIVLCVEPAVYRARYSERDKDLRTLEGVPWWWVDGGAALMAILLAAVDEGLAAGFHGGRGMDEVRRILGIPDDVEVVGVVTVGHPAPDRRSRSLARGRRRGTVHRERW